MRVVADQVGIECLTVGERNLQLGCSPGDVAVGEDEAIQRENKALTAAGDFPLRSPVLQSLWGSCAALYVDLDDGGTDFVGCAYHCIRVGIQQAFVRTDIL